MSSVDEHDELAYRLETIKSEYKIALTGTESGRSVLRDLIRKTKVLEISQTNDAIQLARNDGARVIGLYILKMLDLTDLIGK